MGFTTVGDVIRRLLPKGTDRQAANSDWAEAPLWAPDVFAVAATIVNESGCYAEPGISLSRNDADRKRKKARADMAHKIGEEWACAPKVPTKVKELWTDLWHSMNEPLEGQSRKKNWKAAAMALVAIADEACAGAGYYPSQATGIAGTVWAEFLNPAKKKLPHLPNSIALDVDPALVCVLPKAQTPEVGCNLRSLTHNLALLPAASIVRASWRIGGIPDLGNHALNLLLLPFPYVVRGTDFKVSRESEKPSDGYFTIDQGWLWSAGRPISVKQLSGFVSDMITAAQLDVETIHGVVFPEVALTRTLAQNIARTLGKLHSGLELVACGTFDLDERRNEAVLLRLDEGEVVGRFVQSKHHRWRFDGRQIRQYHLGASLDPERIWWEDIWVHGRAIEFGLNRHEAVISTLICEDLARSEPVLPVLTAVGPSLVIALLMDGPQLEARWSARYATVLAEDPGSSVLTLTSLGMVERWVPPGTEVNRTIGLWKDRHTPATELCLPEHALGLVLSLAVTENAQRTLDGRSDGGGLVEYRLSGVRAVSIANPPSWLERAEVSSYV